MEHPLAADVAWEIHRNFPKALSFLNANGPVQQIKAQLRMLLAETDGCSVDKKEKRDELAFALTSWLEEPFLIAPPKEYSTTWLFWFDDFNDNLVLWLGADPQNDLSASKLQEIARTKPDLFPADFVGQEIGGWPRVWSMQFLGSEELRKSSRDLIFAKLQARWQAFRDKRLSEFMALLGHVK
jgi:hypothetical protein